MEFSRLRREIEEILGLPVNSTDPDKECKMEAVVRDEAIESACSNMLLARQLERKDIPTYMVLAAKLPDDKLAQVVRGSRILYGRYLRDGLSMN